MVLCIVIFVYGEKSLGLFCVSASLLNGDITCLCSRLSFQIHLFPVQSLKTEFLTSEQRVICLLFSVIKIISSSGAKIIQATVCYKSHAFHKVRDPLL